MKYLLGLLILNNMKYLIFLIKNSIHIPTIVVIIFLNRIFKIKFYAINVSRLGHLVEDYYVFLNNIKYQKCIIFKNHLDLNVCNKELMEIINKKINFFKFSKLLEKPIWILNMIRKRYGFFNNINLVNKYYKKDGYTEYNLGEIKLEYSKNQKLIFEQLLLKYNIKQKNYICVSFWEMGHLDINKYDFSHHSHRLSKCKFSNYIKTIKYLIGQGYKVVRIGKNSKITIDIDDKENFIDISMDNHKNEILDIMLLNYCKCFLTTSGGLDYLGFMFDKPMLINSPIVDNIFSEKKNIIYLLKEHFNKKTKKVLNFQDIKNMDLGFVPKAEYFKNKSIEIRDNNEDKILNAVKKLLYLIDDDNNYQIYYNESVKHWNIYKDYISLKHPHLKKYFEDIKCLSL